LPEHFADDDFIHHYVLSALLQDALLVVFSKQCYLIL